MTNLEKAKQIIKENVEGYKCGIFDTNNIMGDPCYTIYDENGLTIDACDYYGYFEVFGLSSVEFLELEEYYEECCKNLNKKESTQPKKENKIDEPKFIPTAVIDSDSIVELNFWGRRLLCKMCNVDNIVQESGCCPVVNVSFAVIR